eukprot:GFUD01028855.1.p1 GENE.GFUD01028855.1~~GFUD01028855.1.p1  ORF type:complete len:454 (+),score=137.93 GFUD01028855.1:54-1415(+)
MSYGYFNIPSTHTPCLVCLEPMGLTVNHVTEHLQRKHHLVTSAAVLAANMFANSQANGEVWIVLREFDGKNAAIEHMERTKTTALQFLALKDVEIAALIEQVKNLKNQLLAHTQAEAVTSRLIQRIDSERLQLLDRNASLTDEMKILRQTESELSTELQVLEKKLKCENEREAENARLKDSVKVMKTQLISLKKGVFDERRAFNFRISCLTTELLETNERLENLEREKELSQTNCEDLQNLCMKWEDIIDKKCVEATKLSKNLEEVKMDKEVVEMERFQVMAGLNDQIRQKNDFNLNNDKWETLVNEKMKETEDMRKCFEKERSCKEYAIREMRNEFRNALRQANLLYDDLMKHQQRLIEHFQTILKGKQMIRSLDTIDPNDGGTVKNLFEEALESAVKCLVANNNGSVGHRVLKISSDAEELQNYLSESIPPAEEDCTTSSEKEDDNNNNNK